ncbi:MAG: hypothetical protein PVH61_37570 [Candidatus Aminicenantes bacterium]|jgi:hypothetical protein
MTKKDFPEFPEYLVKKKLGEGGMASVYLAVQEKLHRKVFVDVSQLSKLISLIYV